MHSFVIFGTSGDLTSRKLIPALFKLKRKKYLPEPYRVIGFSRSELSDQEFRDQLRETTSKFVEDFDQAAWQEFSQSLFYVPGDINHLEDFQRLLGKLDELENHDAGTRVYYLSTSPSLYATAIDHIGEAHRWAQENLGSAALRGNLARRIVVEKPFGTDLDSAVALNQKLHDVFSEKQIYRIDHYLGKETVQNIMVLRFANTIFEPIWNSQLRRPRPNHCGRRGRDRSPSRLLRHVGDLRDMFQNHILQLMMMTAMEPPARYDAALVRDEKVKVLHSCSNDERHRFPDTLISWPIPRLPQ